MAILFFIKILCCLKLKLISCEYFEVLERTNLERHFGRENATNEVRF